MAWERWVFIVSNYMKIDYIAFELEIPLSDDMM